MPRRALRKPIPNVDLRGCLVEWTGLPSPWSTATLFGVDRPLIVEIGSGKGMFLQQTAPHRPWENFLGIELSRKYAEFAAARIVRAGLPNVRVLQGNALRLLAEVLPDASVAEVHIYFPDPWWKQRHRRRRVMTSTAVRDIQRVLSPGGRLEFWTDVLEYFQSTLRLIAETTELLGPFAEPEQPALHDMDYRTHFERRVRLNGLPVYRAYYRR